MRKAAQGNGGITLEVFKKHMGVMISGPGTIQGSWLDSMTLEVLSSLNDAVILKHHCMG